jgi:hypothetical protein
VPIYQENNNRNIDDGTMHRGCKRIGLVSAGAIAIILLFILSGASQAQPRATIQPSPQAVPLNQQLNITLELVWTGEVDAYDIPQPDASMLAEFRVVGRSLSAERRDGENVLRHDILLQPLKEGEYDVSRIRVGYFEKEKDVPMRISLPQTMVTVLPPKLIPNSIWVAAGVSAFAAAAVTAVMIVRGKIRKNNGPVSAVSGRRDELLLELNDAVALRIEGEIGAYMDKLCALANAKELEPHIGKLDQLRELTESVKFGGLIPSPDQLSWAEKKVKGAIREAFPIDDPEE